MKKILSFLVMAALLLSAVAYAGAFEDCTYYQQNGVHKYVDDGYDTYPTCSQEGIKWVKCTVCGYRGISPVPTTDHKYGSWTVVKAATENAAGVHTRTCTVCNTVNTEEFYPNGTVYHHRVESVITSMQEMLVQLGYLNKATGVYDRATENAVKQIQREANFPIDGIAWPQTMNYIKAALGIQQNTEATEEAPVQTPPAQMTPLLAAPATPVMEQYASCYQTYIDAGKAVVYCADHLALSANYQAMVNLAQNDTLKAEVLRMYQRMLETELEQLYLRWQDGAAAEIKQVATSHQKMTKNYLSMQELSWKIIYGSEDIRVLENVVDALMSQCASVCMMMAQCADGK